MNLFSKRKNKRCEARMKNDYENEIQGKKKTVMHY